MAQAGKVFRNGMGTSSLRRPNSRIVRREAFGRGSAGHLSSRFRERHPRARRASSSPGIEYRKPEVPSHSIVPCWSPRSINECSSASGTTAFSPCSCPRAHLQLVLSFLRCASALGKLRLYRLP
jgi:hypothetical protein